jgi:hypothetical protein
MTRIAKPRYLAGRAQLKNQHAVPLAKTLTEDIFNVSRDRFQHPITILYFKDRILQSAAKLCQVLGELIAQFIL